MTPEKYRLASELFQRVRELAKDHRESALDEACNGDGELREQVLELLAGDEAVPSSFLNLTALEDAAALIAPAEPDLLAPGDVIASRYRVIERIGAGGMGVCTWLRICACAGRSPSRWYRPGRTRTPAQRSG
jgi:hypothetical protein